MVFFSALDCYITSCMSKLYFLKSAIYELGKKNTILALGVLYRIRVIPDKLSQYVMDLTIPDISSS